MKEKYQINGPNTLYMVWGILSLVITSIFWVLYLLSLISSLTVTAWMSDEFGSYVVNAVTAYTIWFFLIIAAILAVQTVADILLIRDYITHKEVLIVFAVLHFVFAVFCVFLLVIAIAVRSVVAILMCLLIILCWITTGVLLILKQSKAILGYGTRNQARKNAGSLAVDDIAGKTSFGSQWQGNQNLQVVGIIEGQFGAYQGRRSELYAGRIYKIGRESGCEIQVNHPKVSRIHCTVCKLPNGGYQITDCSSNGTFYDNIKLQKGVAMEVKPGGLLVLGEADNVLQLK